MKKSIFGLFCSLILCFLGVSSQTRYCNEVFSQVDSSDNIVYSTNRIFWPFTTGLPPQGNLTMTFYEPAGDTASARPLMIILQGGNFLPQPYNQSVMGSRYDSSVVELCKRFARRGFVAAAVSYRQGWNAISSDQDARTSTLLKAVYRAVQDVKGAVRFFKKDAATSNLFRVDPDKIGLMGLGSAGFISMAYATLNKYEEISLPKFLDGNTALPYVDTLEMGNFDGFGGNLDYNIPNWPGFDSKIAMVINAGGALGDSTWLEPGEVPVICFHVPGDPYAPYTEGMVLVPTTGGNVVYVSGPYQIESLCNSPLHGDNNAVFRNPPFIDPVTTAINQRNEGIEGLCPFFTTPQQQSGPWDWWDNTNAVNLWGQEVVSSELITSPNMSKNYAMAYIDTMMAYSVPRFIRVLGFNNCPGFTEVPDKNSQNWTVYPNPFQNSLKIQSALYQANITLTIKNTAGQVVFSENRNSVHLEYLDLSALKAGIYLLEANSNLGVYQTKIIKME